MSKIVNEVLVINSWRDLDFVCDFWRFGTDNQRKEIERRLTDAGLIVEVSKVSGTSMLSITVPPHISISAVGLGDD